MNVQFRASFVKDLRSINDKDTLRRIKETVEQIEQAQDLGNIPNLKKLKGSGNYFRVRVGEYRIGMAIENQIATLVRCLNRKEIYRYFP